MLLRTLNNVGLLTSFKAFNDLPNNIVMRVQHCCEMLLTTLLNTVILLDYNFRPMVVYTNIKRIHELNSLEYMNNIYFKILK